MNWHRSAIPMEQCCPDSSAVRIPLSEVTLVDFSVNIPAVYFEVIVVYMYEQMQSTDKIACMVKLIDMYDCSVHFTTSTFKTETQLLFLGHYLERRAVHRSHTVKVVFKRKCFQECLKLFNAFPLAQAQKVAGCS